jgi:hypothetical protein
MAGRLMTFRPRLPPLDQRLQLAGQLGAEQLLGIKVHLRAETAADVRRNHAQQMFRNTDRLGDPAPVHERHLVRQIDRHPAIDTGCRKNGTGFEGRSEGASC